MFAQMNAMRHWWAKKRGDEAIEVTLFLTTISTTFAAINTPAATGNILTTIATTCGAINVPAPLKEFYMVVNRDIFLTTILTIIFILPFA